MWTGKKQVIDNGLFYLKKEGGGIYEALKEHNYLSTSQDIFWNDGPMNKILKFLIK